MKIRLTLKDPDGVYDSISEFLENNTSEEEQKLPEDELETMLYNRRNQVDDACGKWIEFGEYVTVEVDMATGLAVVVPA